MLSHRPKSPSPSFSFLILLIFFYSHQAATVALPALPQNGQSLGINVNSPPSTNNNDLSVTKTVETVVEDLLRWTRAQPDPRLRQSSLLGIRMRVDNNGDLFNPTMSDDINRFKRIRCLFRYGGSPAAYDDTFQMHNQWPQQWDRWDLSPQPLPGVGENLRAFSLEAAARRLSVEWADQLLKASGRRGRYGEVILVQNGGRPLGWCFAFLEIQPGVRSARLVVVATGQVLGAEHCLWA
ncbi:MAG: hypothetical protein LQ339_002471 [Xanthoria mediterranea]|nr:MAG: hypothetical protein LQ339_002471 [Xanthoria mediterranea]